MAEPMAVTPLRRDQVRVRIAKRALDHVREQLDLIEAAELERLESDGLWVEIKLEVENDLQAARVHVASAANVLERIHADLLLRSI